MVWRCRRQRVHRFYLRCYKKDFGEKWSHNRYRFKINLSCVRIQDRRHLQQRPRTSRKGMDEAGQNALKCSRAGDHVTALRDVLERLLHWLAPADLKSCDSAKRLPTRKLREGWRTQSS